MAGFCLAIFCCVVESNAIDSTHLDKNPSINSSDLEAIASSPKWLALLHFKGRKSLIGADSGFFLHKNGYKNAQAELVATLESINHALRQNTINDEKSPFCRFPARVAFLSNYFPHIAEITKRSEKSADSTQSRETAQTVQNLQSNTQDLESTQTTHTEPSAPFVESNTDSMQSAESTPSIDSYHCAGFSEFSQIVPFDEVSLAFAGESEIFPGSAMGHIFLVASGIAKENISKEFSRQTLENGAEISNALEVKKGEKQSYAISFFATTELGINPIPYIRAVFGNLNGIYSLMPLDSVEFEYLQNEQRSIWTLQLKLNEKQKAMLRAHLWELKDVPIDYDFITHNCNDALKFLLKVADLEFYTPQLKPYQTPTEYLKSLQKAGKITNITIKTPESKQAFIARYGTNDILNTRDSAKASVGYVQNGADSLLDLYFAPIYSDIKNAQNAYKEHIQSRLLSFNVRYNASQNRAFIHKIEFLHLFSAPDTLRTRRLVKHIDVSFENPIWEQERTRLKPNISLGAGLGSYVGRISLYALPLLGYEYVRGHNAFINLRFGAIASFPRVKLIGSYDYFIDFIRTERGYQHKLNAFAGVNVYKQIDIFASFSYLQNQRNIVQCGMSVNF